MITITALCTRSFHDLRFEEYGTLFTRIADTQPQLKEGCVNPGGAVVQFWDREPDEQVRTLLDATRQQCQIHKIAWVFFDDERAQDFLSDAMGAEFLQAYRYCIHPAQRSDFFRYCYLYKHGGMWLDTDQVLIKSPAQLLSQRLPVFLQRTRNGRITNWFLATPAQHPVFKTLLETCLRNLSDEELREQCMRRRDILSLTGIVAINRVMARFAYQHLCDEQPADPPFLIIHHTLHDQLIRPGASWLGEQLHYKNDHRAWQKWCSEVTENPLDPAVQEQLRLSCDNKSR